MGPQSTVIQISSHKYSTSTTDSFMYNFNKAHMQNLSCNTRTVIYGNNWNRKFCGKAFFFLPIIGVPKSCIVKLSFARVVSAL